MYGYKDEGAPVLTHSPEILTPEILTPEILKFALVGAGLIGVRHAHAIAQHPHAGLSVIIDPAAPAQKLAEDLGARHFSDIDQFFASGEAIDAVIIATPNNTHRPFALAFIEKGVPCLIEKPLAANSEDALAIVKASQQAGVPVLVGHHRRHHDVSHVMRQKIDQGAFGQIVGGQLTWMLRKPDEYYDAGKWRIEKGGGPIWINLIHEIDLVRYFLGEIVAVSAMASNDVRGNEVEESAVINMRFESGAMLSAIVSDTAPSPWHFEGGSAENPNICPTNHGGLRLFGTRGAIEFPQMRHWQHDTPDGHWGEAIKSDTNAAADIISGEAILGSQIEHFIAIIQNHTTPLVTAQDGYQNVVVVEAIHEAIKTGATVPIPLI